MYALGIQVYKPANKAEVRVVYRIRGTRDPTLNNTRHQKSYSFNKYGEQGAWELAQKALQHMAATQTLPDDFPSIIGHNAALSKKFGLKTNVKTTSSQDGSPSFYPDDDPRYEYSHLTSPQAIPFCSPTHPPSSVVVAHPSALSVPLRSIARGIEPPRCLTLGSNSNDSDDNINNNNNNNNNNIVGDGSGDPYLRVDPSALEFCTSWPPPLTLGSAVPTMNEKLDNPSGLPWLGTSSSTMNNSNLAQCNINNVTGSLTGDVNDRSTVGGTHVHKDFNLTNCSAVTSSSSYTLLPQQDQGINKHTDFDKCTPSDGEQGVEITEIDTKVDHKPVKKGGAGVSDRVGVRMKRSRRSGLTAHTNKSVVASSNDNTNVPAGNPYLKTYSASSRRNPSRSGNTRVTNPTAPISDPSCPAAAVSHHQFEDTTALATAYANWNKSKVMRNRSACRFRRVTRGLARKSGLNVEEGAQQAQIASRSRSYGCEGPRARPNEHVNGLQHRAASQLLGATVTAGIASDEPHDKVLILPRDFESQSHQIWDAPGLPEYVISHPISDLTQDQESLQLGTCRMENELPYRQWWPLLPPYADRMAFLALHSQLEGIPTPHIEDILYNNNSSNINHINNLSTGGQQCANIGKAQGGTAQASDGQFSRLSGGLNGTLAGTQWVDLPIRGRVFRATSSPLSSETSDSDYDDKKCGLDKPSQSDVLRCNVDFGFDAYESSGVGTSCPYPDEDSDTRFGSPYYYRKRNGMRERGTMNRNPNVTRRHSQADSCSFQSLQNSSIGLEANGVQFMAGKGDKCMSQPRDDSVEPADSDFDSPVSVGEQVEDFL